MIALNGVPPNSPVTTNLGLLVGVGVLVGVKDKRGVGVPVAVRVGVGGNLVGDGAIVALRVGIGVLTAFSPLAASSLGLL